MGRNHCDRMHRYLVHAELAYSRFEHFNSPKLARCSEKKAKFTSDLEHCSQQLNELQSELAKTEPQSVEEFRAEFNMRDCESTARFLRRQITYYAERLDEINAQRSQLAENVQLRKDELAEHLATTVKAPLSPMTGTNFAVQRALQNRAAAGKRLRTGPPNNVAEWTAFAADTMNIPLVLMETHAVEAHVVLAFNAPQSRQLPGDVLAILSGYAVGACLQTRRQYKCAGTTVPSDEVAQKLVVEQYECPDSENSRRVYVRKWAAAH